MNVAQLQAYLDYDRKKDGGYRGFDMCGKYARCRYCVRFEEYPCAVAHNSLVQAMQSGEAELIPEWFLPEPPIADIFGTDVAESMNPVVEEAQAEQSAPEEEQPAEAQPQEPVAEESAPEEERSAEEPAVPEKKLIRIARFGYLEPEQEQPAAQEQPAPTPAGEKKIRFLGLQRK